MTLLCAALALLAFPPAASLLRAQTPAPSAIIPDLNDRGVFEIFSEGKSVGTETFEITVHPDRVETAATGELHLEQSGKKIEVRTASDLVLSPKLDPLSYTWNQKGAQSSQLSVDFHTQPARAHYKTVNGQDDRRDFKLDKDVVLLDDNVICHYELAIARYDAAKGGTQVFRGFIPQEALPGVITLSLAGVDDTNFAGEKAKMRHFLLTSELAQINLWVDDSGRLQGMSAADTKFQAVRKKH